MTTLFDFFANHAVAGWLAAAAVLLIAELASGSGWLLWPAGSAAVVGLITLGPHLTVVEQAAVFAVLTIASTYIGRRFLGPGPRRGHDLNDPLPRLIGREGRAATSFEGGRGRVFVDGKEWAAELEGAGPVAPGGRIEVVALVGGARLKVRAG